MAKLGRQKHSFFPYQCSNKKKKKNIIASLQKPNETWIFTSNEIESQILISLKETFCISNSADTQNLNVILLPKLDLTS